jgi:hypothetical protein
MRLLLRMLGVLWLVLRASISSSFNNFIVFFFMIESRNVHEANTTEQPFCEVM